MPHQLEQINGETSFAYNGTESPWHRLGVPMSGLATADAMLAAANADYTVSVEPLYTTVPGVDGFTEIEVGRATVRTVSDDRDPADRVLGVVGNRYHVVQNRDVLERAVTIVGADVTSGAVIDTCGVLGKGERFFAFLDLGTVAVDPEGINDKLTRGLGVLTSHDGSGAITYALSNIRWVCNNTVNAGLRTAARTFSARHTANVESALTDAQRVLGLSVSWEQEFSVLAERLLRVNDGGSAGQAHDLLDRVEQRLWKPSPDPTDHALTIAENRRNRLHGLLDSPTCGENFGYNGWSVFNAFVEYADHARPRLSDERLAEAAMFGQKDAWKDTVADLVLA